jgi:mycothiol synthase
MPDLPDGYTARPVDPEADLRSVFEVSTAAAIAEYGVPDVTEEMIARAWQLPSLDLQRDSWIVSDPTGRAVGFCVFLDNEEAHVAPRILFRLDPDLASEPVTDAILAWARDRARRNLPLAVPDARVALTTGVASVNERVIAALERNGWSRDRVNWVMEIDLASAALPAPDWPDGITVRTADLEVDAPAIHAAEADAFSDHYGFLPQPYDRWLHFRTRFMRPEPDLWFLAMAGDEIVAMALCSSERPGEPDVGWVSSLGVRRPWRKRGLGLAMLRHAFREIAARGKPRAGLGVDSQSLTGATRLYEKAGMRVVQQHFDYELLLREGRDLRTTQLA